MERTLKMYQVDAFSKQLFGGNPAAVCVLEHWLDADLMQQLAMEEHPSELVNAALQELVRNSNYCSWNKDHKN